MYICLSFSRINDRVVSANNVSFEGVDYATAVQILRDSGQTVKLVIKRRMLISNMPANPSSSKNAIAPPVRQNKGSEILHLSLQQNNRHPSSVQLGVLFYVKEVKDKFGYNNLREGDILHRINNFEAEDLTLLEAQGLIANRDDPVELVVERGGSQPFLRSNLTDGLLTTVPQTPEKNNNALIYSGANGNAAANENGTAMDVVDGGGGGNFPPRRISFKKCGNVGVRLTGGNDVGIFVTAVQPGSPAANEGLQPGDKLLKVNEMEMRGVTREEAVLFLLSLQDEINLVAQFRRTEYDEIVANQKGDSFYIRTHINYPNPGTEEMAFGKHEVFHVVDTLYNGVLGSYQVFKMRNGSAGNHIQTVKGVIPNQARAEDISTQEFNAIKRVQQSSEQPKSIFLKRRRDKDKRRSKSLGKDHWEDLIWSESKSKFPAYEKVVFQSPRFKRPVVIFGAVSDLARSRLFVDHSSLFEYPRKSPNLMLYINIEHKPNL